LPPPPKGGHKIKIFINTKFIFALRAKIQFTQRVNYFIIDLAGDWSHLVFWKKFYILYMKITKLNPMLALVNDYLIDSPAALN
jgi:hypothetical protein